MRTMTRGLLLLVSVLLLLPTSRAMAAENLVPNPGFESSSASMPTGWIKGRWGVNTALFTYPVSSSDGSKAAQVSLTSRTSGDAKWAFPRVPLTPGKTYEYKNIYKADVRTFVTAEFKLSDGSLVYEDLGSPSADATWVPFKTEFVAPPNTVEGTVFHLVNQVGTLSLDNVSLAEVTASPNLVPNPTLTAPGASGKPASWNTGRWGTNSAIFTYPVSGSSDASAVRVELTSHATGDAKWHFSHVPVEPNTSYEFRDMYRSNTTSFTTVQLKKTDGTFSYLDLGTHGPSSTWSEFKKTFTTPENITSLTVFHLIKNVGHLETDTFSLKKISQDPSKLDKGYISLNFDDGWLSVYENAIPILNEAGFKSSQFIITERLSNQFPGYMKPSHVLEMQAAGHEIGAHTRTHLNLTTLSPEEAQREIAGSRGDLLQMGVSPVNFLAYPLGAYNSTVQQITRDAGYLGARSSDGGPNQKGQDIFALRRYSMEASTTLDQVKSIINSALTNKTWNILLFHEVNTSGDRYAVTPAFFGEVVNHLKSLSVTSITVQQGVELLTQE